MPGAWRPRQMFPPPTTTAIWTPRSTTSASCRPISAVASVLMPEPSNGANASPESLRRTRWYSVLPMSVTVARAPLALVASASLVDGLAQLVSDEPPDGNLLSDLGSHLVEQLLDRLRVVLHVRLLEEHVVLVVGAQLALDDLLDHLVRLARLLRLDASDVLLLSQDVRRDLLARQPPRSCRARDVQGDALHQGAELVGVRDEVRLAVHFDQHTHGVVEMDVAVDQPLVRRSTRALRHRCETLLAEELDRTLHVSAGLLQRALAIHHPGARALAELLDLLGGDLAHRSDPSVASALGSSGSATTSGSASGWSGSKTVLAAILAASSADGTSSSAGPGAAEARRGAAVGRLATAFSTTSSFAIP